MQAVVIQAWSRRASAGQDCARQRRQAALGLGAAARDPVRPAIERRADQPLVGSGHDLVDRAGRQRDALQRLLPRQRRLAAAGRAPGRPSGRASRGSPPNRSGSCRPAGSARECGRADWSFASSRNRRTPSACRARSRSPAGRGSPPRGACRANCIGRRGSCRSYPDDFALGPTLDRCRWLSQLTPITGTEGIGWPCLKTSAR